MNMPNELTDAILYCLFSGILSAGAVTGVFLLLRVMLYVPFMQKKWLENAKEKGNYATALLFKYPLAWSFSNGRELWSYFVYRFSVNGKDYKVRVKLTGHAYRHPVKERTVYWLKSPSHAAAEQAIGRIPDYAGKLMLVLSVIFCGLLLLALLSQRIGVAA